MDSWVQNIGPAVAGEILHVDVVIAWIQSELVAGGGAIGGNLPLSPMVENYNPSFSIDRLFIHGGKHTQLGGNLLLERNVRHSSGGQGNPGPEIALRGSRDRDIDLAGCEQPGSPSLELCQLMMRGTRVGHGDGKIALVAVYVQRGDMERGDVVDFNRQRAPGCDLQSAPFNVASDHRQHKLILARWQANFPARDDLADLLASGCHDSGGRLHRNSLDIGQHQLKLTAGGSSQLGAEHKGQRHGQRVLPYLRCD